MSKNTKSTNVETVVAETTSAPEVRDIFDVDGNQVQIWTGDETFARFGSEHLVLDVTKENGTKFQVLCGCLENEVDGSTPAYSVYAPKVAPKYIPFDLAYQTKNNDGSDRIAYAPGFTLRQLLIAVSNRKNVIFSVTNFRDASVIRPKSHIDANRSTKGHR